MPLWLSDLFVVASQTFLLARNIHNIFDGAISVVSLGSSIGYPVMISRAQLIIWWEQFLHSIVRTFYRLFKTQVCKFISIRLRETLPAGGGKLQRGIRVPDIHNFLQPSRLYTTAEIECTLQGALSGFNW